MNIVCLGATSFLLRGVLPALREGMRVHVAERAEIEAALASTHTWPDADVVLSFLWPQEARKELTDERALEARVVASLPASSTARFVMLSSRTVYDPAEERITEDSRLAPSSAYGKNKARAEDEVRAACRGAGRPLTILRVSNVFGFEYPIRRPTFMSTMLHSLAEHDRIRIDGDPSRKKDLLSVDMFGRILRALLPRLEDDEVINVGSGVPLSLERIARELIAGYGSGDVALVESEGADASFFFDVKKLRDLLSATTWPTQADIVAALQHVGQTLRG